MKGLSINQKIIIILTAINVISTVINMYIATSSNIPNEPSLIIWSNRINVSCNINEFFAIGENITCGIPLIIFNNGRPPTGNINIDMHSPYFSANIPEDERKEALNNIEGGKANNTYIQLVNVNCPVVTPSGHFCNITNIPLGKLKINFTITCLFCRDPITYSQEICIYENETDRENCWK